MIYHKKIAFVLLGAIFISGVTTGVIATSALTTSFSDVRTTDWFYNDVMNVVSWDVVRGNPDGTFAPSRNINRAEFAAMLSRYDKYLETKFMLKSGLPPNPSTNSANMGNTNINLNSNVSQNSSPKLGTKGSLNGVSLTIFSLTEYVSDNTYLQPKAGNKYLAAEVLIENNSGNTIEVNPLNFSMFDLDSFEYDPSSRKEPSLGVSTLDNGRSVRGFITFEVPKTTMMGINLSEIKYEIDYGRLGQMYVKLY